MRRDRSLALTRRTLNVSGAALAGTLPASLRLARSGYVVFDSRSARSRAWAATRTGQAIDVAQPPIDLWRALETIPARATLSGMTGWSDFLTIRDHLRAAGLRLRHVGTHTGIAHWRSN